MIRHFVCTSFHLYSDTTYKVLLYLSMCAHRSRRQSNQLRSTSKSWEVCHAASASVSVPTWDLFQKEHVHPYGVRGFRVCPLSRWIYRGWDTLWWRRWGRDYVFLSVHVSLQPVAKSSSSEHLTVFFLCFSASSTHVSLASRVWTLLLVFAAGNALWDTLVQR